jgi:phosphate-selective porin OprO/OprP
MKIPVQIAALLLWTTVCWGQSAEPAATKQPSTYDRIWKFSQWYKNDGNPVVQSVVFTGRFQHDFAIVDADQGSHNESNVRRMRVGLKSKIFRTFTLHGEVELNPQEANPVYSRLTDVYLQWSKSNDLRVTVGKHAAPFTAEGATSSKELLTIDRSNLANNMWFPNEYFPGVSAAGEHSNWTYHAGLYSSGRANKEFGEFNGSVFTLAVIGYDFGGALNMEEALLTGNYVFQNPDVNNTFTRQLHHTVSANLQMEDDRWGLRSDFTAASGYLSQSDLWGTMVMPFYNITKNLQAVGRHTFVKSENPNGVQPATYENRIVSSRGDRYNEFYLGANYYFYGHKLKVQSGVQFADTDDRAGDGGAYNGVSWVTGLRASW